MNWLVIVQLILNGLITALNVILVLFMNGDFLRSNMINVLKVILIIVSLKECLMINKDVLHVRKDLL